jgi:hypothetical protein
MSLVDLTMKRQRLSHFLRRAGKRQYTGGNWEGTSHPGMPLA